MLDNMPASIKRKKLQVLEPGILYFGKTLAQAQLQRWIKEKQECHTRQATQLAKVPHLSSETGQTLQQGLCRCHGMYDPKLQALEPGVHLL